MKWFLKRLSIKFKQQLEYLWSFIWLTKIAARPSKETIIFYQPGKCQADIFETLDFMSIVNALVFPNKGVEKL